MKFIACIYYRAPEENTYYPDYRPEHGIDYKLFDDEDAAWDWAEDNSCDYYNPDGDEIYNMADRGSTGYNVFDIDDDADIADKLHKWFNKKAWIFERK